MIGLFVTVLCFVAASHAAQYDCEKLTKPLEDPDIQTMQGQWGLIGASLRSPKAIEKFKARKSMTVSFENSTYTQYFRLSDGCDSSTTEIKINGHNFTMSIMSINITGTFLTAPSPNCGVLKLDIVAPTYNSSDIYLFSRKRQLEDSEMEEFKALLMCLNMPDIFMMDPTEELCPDQPVTAEPAVEPAVEPAADPAAQPAAEPAADPAAQPAADPAAVQ